MKYFRRIQVKLYGVSKKNNSTLSDKIGSVQYNTALAVKGAIRGTSRENLYQELGLESLQNRR